MRTVIAYAGPVNYLILIEHIDLLRILFENVYIPEIVCGELRHEKAAGAVRQWIMTPPDWVEIVAAGAESDDPVLARLDDGERAAIQLAVRISADLVLMDDRDGVAVARSKGFAVTGTLGVLDLAARRGMIRLNDAFARLGATNFRCPPQIIQALLAAHSGQGQAAPPGPEMTHE